MIVDNDMKCSLSNLTLVLARFLCQINEGVGIIKVANFKQEIASWDSKDSQIIVRGILIIVREVSL